jgi:hypothetical protein
MDIITGIFDFGFARGLFFQIPETLGLFFFGIGLVAIAVSIRWVIGRESSLELDEKES